MEAISFDGQVAIVTGGGRNLGRGHALELARRGASVVVSDMASPEQRGSSVADDVVAEIEATGGAAVAAYESVATEEGAQAIVQTALDRFGTVDVVINNAGIMLNGFFEELTADRFDAVTDVSLRGSFLVTQAAWPVLREQGYGRVVMTSSAGGMFSCAGLSNYAAAKAGVYGLCKALAYEGAEHGIRVNTILPMAGAMTSKDAPPPGHATNYPPELRDALAPRRSSDNVVPLVIALASKACAVSGEAYSAAFGRYARVFVGVTPGWIGADPSTVTADDIAAHFDEIRDLDGYVVPDNQYDEVIAIAASLEAAGLVPATGAAR
jgi:NAD(P)-dependent dehydrogenase (short-subunit alcohol dehydrogenase family)